MLSKKLILFCACGLIVATTSAAFAQDSLDEEMPVETSKAKRPMKPAKGNWFVRPGLAFWQESIDLKNATSKAKMETQSEGILVDAGYIFPTRNPRWKQIYGLGFGNGRIKGKGNTTDIPDELRGQPWMIFSASVGLMYRPSPVSEIGLVAPFQYRAISWAIKKGSTLDPDRDASFSIGLGLAYVARFSKRSSLYLSLTQQHLWEATVWGAAWQLEFL